MPVGGCGWGCGWGGGGPGWVGWGVGGGDSRGHRIPAACRGMQCSSCGECGGSGRHGTNSPFAFFNNLQQLPGRRASHTHPSTSRDQGGPCAATDATACSVIIIIIIIMPLLLRAGNWGRWPNMQATARRTRIVIRGTPRSTHCPGPSAAVHTQTELDLSPALLAWSQFGKWCVSRGVQALQAGGRTRAECTYVITAATHGGGEHRNHFVLHLYGSPSSTPRSRRSYSSDF